MFTVRFILLPVTSFCFMIAVEGQSAEIIKDIEGNTYKTVVIGRQRWMKENLKTRTFNDGAAIPFIKSDSTWSVLRSPGCCLYGNEESNARLYGTLYNWYAVNTGKLCPAGWHVPDDEEWKYLEGYADTRYGTDDPVWDKPGLRGYDQGKRLKSASGWKMEGNGSDVLGFTALPGGERLIGGRYFTGKSNGFFWSSTPANVLGAWFRIMIYSFDEVSRDVHDKRFGFSVRCISDK